MYDDLALTYDLFNDWPTRLAREIPWLEGWLGEAGGRRILDAACGTGWHALALAQRGFEVTGADLSPGMIARARDNAAREGVAVDFVVAAFQELPRVLASKFDAVLCLGNSLPHVIEEEALLASLAGMGEVLKEGGRLLIQNRNFAKVLAEGERFMPLKAACHQGQDLLFWRFYDFLEGGRLRFNVVVFHQAAGQWRHTVHSSLMRPLMAPDLERALRAAGFGAIVHYGDYRQTPFDPATSPDLVTVATKCIP
jgi:ubiquinone/menaquinone biosynthesis C-methylase UbiE